MALLQLGIVFLLLHVSHPCPITVSSKSQALYPLCCCKGDAIPCGTLGAALNCTKPWALQGTQSDVAISLDSSPLKISSSGYNYIYALKNFSLIGRNEKVEIECEAFAGLNINISYNVLLANLTFSNCGQVGFVRKDLYLSSGLFIVNSFNLHIFSVTIKNSKMRGLSLYNCSGDIYLHDVWLVNNSNCSMDGGGVAIIIPHRDPLLPTNITCSQVYFIHNKAWNTGCNEKPANSRGGGMLVVIETSDVSLELNHVKFINNAAYWGSGLYVSFYKNSSNNHMIINSSLITQEQQNQYNYKQAKSRGGGAMIVFSEESTGNDYNGNNVTITNSDFTINMAATGGGLVVIAASSASNTGDKLTIKNCKFIDNVGESGSAIYISKGHAGEQPVLDVDIVDTVFRKNKVPNLPRPLGWGAVYTYGISITFRGQNHFENNTHSALVTSVAGLCFAPDSITVFLGNEGQSGGAIALLNTGYMVLENNSTLLLYDNTANDKGNAIYINSFGELTQWYKHRPCLSIQIAQQLSALNITFINNKTSKRNNSIYMDYFLSCEPVINNNTFWHFPNSSYKDQVVTDPARFNVSEIAQLVVYPGWESTLPLSIYDDLNHTISDETGLIFQLQEESCDNALLNPLSSYVSGMRFILYKNKQPKSGPCNATLLVETQSPRVIRVIVEDVVFLPCPPGFQEIPISNESNKLSCSCSDKYTFNDYVICDQLTHKAKLKTTGAALMGYNAETGEYLVGFNMFMDIKGSFFLLPSDHLSLEHLVCGEFHKRGYFCGECEEDYGIDITSNDFKCARCSGDDLGILKFLLIYFGILTIFFLLIVIFNINITYGSIGSCILYFQAITLPDNIIRINHLYKPLIGSDRYTNLLFLPLSIWNLNFNGLIPTAICVNSNLGILPVFALGYVIAFYPLLFLATVFILIELHAYNCQLITCLWRPFHKCFASLRRNWNKQRSIIDTFTAFITLSYMKLTHITLYLLVPVNLYNSAGQVVKKSLLIDPSVEFLSQEHKPYFIVAVATCLLIVLLPPLFLFLYPFKFFRRLLDKLHLHRQCVIVMMDNFLGAYKNGTNRDRDCRWFGSFYLLVRIAIAASNFFSEYLLVQRLIQVLVVAIVLVFLALFQPYRKAIHNKIDQCLAAIIIVSLVLSMYITIAHASLLVIIISGLVLFLPLVGFIVYICYRMAKSCRQKRIPLLGEESSMEFAHRIRQPGAYENLSGSYKIQN